MSTEGSWVNWSTGWSMIFGCNWPLSHSWLDPQLYCCAKSLFSPPLYSLPPLFHELIHVSSASCFPTPFTFLHLVPLTPFRFLSLHTFSLSSHGYFPLFPLSFHPLMHCLFLGGLTCLGLFFLKPFRAPPASRPRTATNTTVDANCSATNVCRPPPATAATTKRVCKRCKPPKDNPVAGSGSSSPPTPSVTAPRSASPGKRSGDDCKANPARATPRRK